MKLLNCPNCNSENVFVDVTNPEHLYGSIRYYVSCTKCDCKGPEEDTYEEAISSWNDSELKCHISKIFKRE